MKRPLALPALLFAAGIAAGWHWPPPVWPALAAAAALGLAALWPRAARLAFPLFLAAAGAASVAWRGAALAPEDLRRVARPEPQLVTLEGRLLRAPEERWLVRDAEVTTNAIAFVEATALRGGGEWRPAAGRVFVSLRGTLPPEFRRGAQVRIEGVLRPPAGPAAPGLFDFAAWLRTRGVHFELRTQGAGDWQAAAPPPPAPWDERFQAWAQAALARGLPVVDRPLHLIWAMTLGWKAGLTDEVEEPFMRSGTMHLFAISGLHIALIAGIVTQALRLLLAPRAVCGAVTIAVVWTYTAATGWQPSAVRATVMTTVVVGGWMLRRPVDLLNSLAAAALAILLWEPRELLGAGFQLSFAVVGALGLLLPAFERWRERLWPADPFLPAEAEPRGRRWARAGWRLASSNAAVSLAAWLGSLPLTAHYFHLVSPVGLLANLVVVPLSSAALACNFASLVLAAWLPAAAELFNHSAWLWMAWADGVSRWAAEVPHGAWHAATPPWPWTAAWFLALAAFGLGWGRWGWRGWTAVAGAAAALAAAGFILWRDARAETRVTVLPQRGGQAVVVERSRGGGVWLLDTGDDRGAPALTGPFLAARGVNRLAGLALSHGDLRHVGGVPWLLGRFRADLAVLPARDYRSAAWDVARAALAAADVRSTNVAAGAAVAGWRVLHPAADDPAPRADDASLVLAGEVDGLRLTVVSDLSRAGQERWLARGDFPATDVLVTGVSGGQALSAAVLARLRPRVVLVADAAQPATARADAATRAALAADGRAVAFLSDAGAVQAGWRAGRLRLRDAAGRELPAARE